VDVVQLQTRSRREGARDLPVLVWRLPGPMRVIASAPHGGGLGVRRWVLNAQVPASYARRDPEFHLAKLGVSLGLAGRGVGMLTAADVRRHATGSDGRSMDLVGTINLVAFLPGRLSDAALVNAVATAAEAKVQAVRELRLDATGTATDALCLVCPDEGRVHSFGGPRSVWGARLARAVHRAVMAGAGAARP